MTEVPRCGDHVRHNLSGEKWVVAWAEGEDLAWSGWPNGIARLSDCTIIKRCSPTEHAAAVEEWRNGSPPHDSRRGRVLRLYGVEDAVVAASKTAAFELPTIENANPHTALGAFIVLFQKTAPHADTWRSSLSMVLSEAIASAVADRDREIAAGESQ